MPDGRNQPLPNTVRIWLSGSIPDDASDDEKKRITDFVRSLAREVFRRGGHLVHGVHPTIADTLVEVAQEYQRDTGERASLVLVVSKYFDPSSEKLREWDSVTRKPTIVTRAGIGGERGQLDKESSLAILRDSLIEQSNVLIAIGGKWWDVSLALAGVPKELELAESQQLPLFLLGGLGGATRDYLREHEELLRRCRNGLSYQQNIELASVVDSNELAGRVIDQIARLPVRVRDPNSGRPFRILSLDGGGIRGAYTASILACWEKLTGLRIVDHFDLIAGTSTGGLIAIGLGLGLSAEELLRFYREDGPEIFPTEAEADRIWHSFRHWFVSKFNQENLKAKLESVFGERTLGDSACRLVIPSYNTTADQLIVYQTPHEPFETIDNPSMNAVTVGLATAAAPTYFDPVATQNVVTNVEAVDGGVWANDPGAVAVTEAVSTLGIPIQRIDMLSIGTTFQPTVRGQPLLIDKAIVGRAIGYASGGWAAKLIARFLWKERRVRGKIGWIANIAEFLMKTQAQTANYVCHGLLDRRYLRINDASSVKSLDDSQAVDLLTGQGETAARHHIHEVRVRFLNGVPADSWKRRECGAQHG